MTMREKANGRATDTRHTSPRLVAMGESAKRAAARAGSRGKGASASAAFGGAGARRGTGFTSGPSTHVTGKTLGGGVEFAKKRLKVGRKVAKRADNGTDTTIRSKSIRLTAQNIHTVGASAGEGGELVGAGGSQVSDANAASKRGTPLAEALNQCAHYNVKTRCDGLNALLEIAEAFPGAIRARAVDVVERVGERLADVEREARKAARECLRRGVVPALGTHGLAPFAKTLILYVGAALTHVGAGVRKDAPAALDALLEAAPALVAAHAPASTLGHLGELLRRGDDGGVGTGSSVQRGVGAQKPATRLALLKSTRRFLTTVVDETIGDGAATKATSAAAALSSTTSTSTSSTTTFVWGDIARNGTSTRALGALHAERSRRAPPSVMAAHYAAEDGTRDDANSGGAQVNGESRVAVRAHAKRLAELAMLVWDDAAQTLADERGVDVDRVRVMAESMACARLALQLADGADEVEIWDTGGGSTAADIVPQLARRTLGAFPVSAPASVAEKNDVAKVREAMVALNFETCRLLIAASSSVAHAALVRHLAPVTLEALPHVLSRALQYVTTCLNGVALDGGAVGAAEATEDSAYVELLGLARESFSLPPWCFSAPMTGSACAELIGAVTQTWERAVADEDGERVNACVTLLTSVLPEEAQQGYSRIPIETAAGWVRHIPRVLWALKHENPVASQKLLSLLHVVAARNPPGSPLADVLTQCETELAVLFFIVPPPLGSQGAKSRPGPFARLPFACQCSAVQLVGVLPTLTAPTMRSLAKMCLDVDRVNVEIPVVAVEALTSNLLAVPLDLTVSFLATLLAGAPGVGFLEKSSKRNATETQRKSWEMSRRVTPRAGAALVALGDAATPWNGALLASAALRNMWAQRVEQGDVEGAARTAAGFGSLVAYAAEFASAVSSDANIDDELSSVIPEILAWLVLHAEHAEEEATMKRILTAAPQLACAVANEIVANFENKNESTDARDVVERAIQYMSTLIQLDEGGDKASSGGVRKAASALQSIAETSQNNDVRKLASAFKVTIDVVFFAGEKH